jgi:predicted nucleotidyltransferase
MISSDTMDDTIMLIREQDEPSGRFVLRIPPALHAALRDSAAEAGISLNEACMRRLATGSHQGDPETEAVLRAMSLLGRDLLGVVAYGSWARGDLRDDSDVDLLVIAAPSVLLSRALYRDWDRQDSDGPLEWYSHPVEVHVAHLPDPDDRISALWAEVALDGIVLYERRYCVSRALAGIRRRILTGELARREAHGHPYWVEAD